MSGVGGDTLVPAASGRRRFWPWRPAGAHLEGVCRHGLLWLDAGGEAVAADLRAGGHGLHGGVRQGDGALGRRLAAAGVVDAVRVEAEVPQLPLAAVEAWAKGVNAVVRACVCVCTVGKLVYHEHKAAAAETELVFGGKEDRGANASRRGARARERERHGRASREGKEGRGVVTT